MGCSYRGWGIGKQDGVFVYKRSVSKWDNMGCSGTDPGFKVGGGQSQGALCAKHT